MYCNIRWQFLLTEKYLEKSKCRNCFKYLVTNVKTKNNSNFLAIDETQLGKRGYMTPLTAKQHIEVLWKNEGK